jgi:CRP-like cAMP-binding protein
MAGLAHALLTGGIVGIMAAIGAKNARFYARMDRLNEFITGKHLQADDPELAEGLRRYFLFRERQCGEQTGGWLDLVSDVSPWFRGQIATIVHGHWISKVSYFHGIDPKTGLEWDVDEHFRIQLACHVKSHIYAPGEVIVHFADPCKDMLVISKGLVGCRGQILKDGDSFGEETIIMHDLDRRRGYCATAITHVVLMHVSGKDICDIMDEPGNEMVKFRIRQQCFWYQWRRVLRRIVRTIRYAARLEFTLTDARTIFKLEFHDTVLDDIPSLWEAWMVLRDENGDPLIHAVKVMQRLARTLRFKRSINEVVQQGTKRRRHQALIQSARGWLAEVKLHAPDECAEIFVKHRMSLELLLSTPLLPSFFVLMGICVADAVLLAEHFKKAAAAQKLGPAHKLSGSTTVE